MSKIYVDEIAGIASADTVAIPGHVIQVVNGTYNTETTFTSTSFTDTGLTATITPTSTSSNILVVVSQNGVGKQSGDIYGHLALFRGSSEIARIDRGAGYTGDSSAIRVGSVTGSYLDSPSTTNAVTYKTSFKMVVGSGFILNDESSVSTITLMEIAG